MSGRALSQVSLYEEIALYTQRAPGPATIPGPPGVRSARYDGFLYSRLPLPIGPADLDAIAPGAAPPRAIGGLPLVGREQLTIHFRPYAEYLSALYAGEDGLRRLQGFLTDSISSPLSHLFHAKPTRSPLRAFWINETPELEDVPWESIGFGERRPARFSIGRGWPPPTVPPLPMPPDRPVNVALIDPGRAAPDAVRAALDDLGHAVRVVRIEAEDPRAALSQAARGGCEMVHIVADASVPLGMEGLLDFPGGATLSPAEAGHIVRGSRIAILTLGAPAAPRAGRDGLPTVFHGFARFGRAVGDGLTVVTPLAPMPEAEQARFLRAFYERFAETLDVEDALAVAAPCPLRAPVVLFLRHRYGRQFHRRAGGPLDVDFEPGGEDDERARASADLAVSSDLLDAAVTVQQRYAALGQPFPGGELIDKERERQRGLAAYLDDALSPRKDR